MPTYGPESANTMTLMAAALAASGSSILEFYFPRAARITRYWAVPSVAEAAHATQELGVVFVDAGTDGAGSTTVATLTNNSGTAQTTKIVSSAWVAHDAKELITNNRPASPTNVQNVWDAVLAGEVIKCTVTKAGGTTTGNVIVGIEYVESV